MKKLLSISVYILVFFNLFSPICEIIARLAELRFSLFNYTVLSAICFCLMLAPALCLFFTESKFELRNYEHLAYSCLPFVSLLNLAFFIIKSDSAAVMALVLLSFLLSLYLAARLGTKRSLKISLISSIPLVLIVAIVIILRPMMSWASGKTAVKESSYSPFGECYVEFVERGTGATGGEVTVRLYRKNFDVYVFSFREKPEILYTGAWGENVQIEWHDNGNLLINGEEYVINK